MRHGCELEHPAFATLGDSTYLFPDLIGKASKPWGRRRRSPRRNQRRHPRQDVGAWQADPRSQEEEETTTPEDPPIVKDGCRGLQRLRAHNENVLCQEALQLPLEQR